MPSASDYFGETVARYDSLIERAVPRYREMLATLAETLPDSATRVLELGCGTGNLTRLLVQRYPRAQLHVVDAAPAMVEATLDRLHRPERVHGVVRRFEDLEFEDDTFDLVTSCISLHHVEDFAGLLRTVGSMLRTGGALVYADQMRGGTEPQHRRNVAAMIEFWRRPGNLTKPEQEELLRHDAEHDHHVTVVDQVHWLESAGFTDLDCVWRNGMWGILSARR